jgi:hypothetical protein
VTMVALVACIRRRSEAISEAFRLAVRLIYTFSNVALQTRHWLGIFGDRNALTIIVEK